MVLRRKRKIRNGNPEIVQRDLAVGAVTGGAIGSLVAGPPGVAVGAIVGGSMGLTEGMAEAGGRGKAKAGRFVEKKIRKIRKKKRR